LLGGISLVGRRCLEKDQLSLAQLEEEEEMGCEGVRTYKSVGRTGRSISDDGGGVAAVGIAYGGVVLGRPLLV